MKKYGRICDVMNPETYDDLLEIAMRVYWRDVKNKSFLITGGAGFIAYYIATAILLVNDLYQNNNRVILMIRDVEKARAKYGVLLEREDLTLLRQDVCEEIVYERCDYIIHAAGGAETRLFEATPVDVFSANALGTQRILDFATNTGAESVVYVSSFTVYGQTKEKTRIFETDIGTLDWNDYKNCYANGKRAGEMLCACYKHQYGTPVRIVRPGFVYGASRKTDSRVYAEIIRNVVNSEEICLQTAGLVYRSMCYVTDVVRGILTVLFGGENGRAYNVATEFLSIREFAFAANNVNKKSKVVFLNPDDESVEVSISRGGIMDCSAIAQLTPEWGPKVSVIQGIRMAAAAMREIR